jgi:hypothetical protein
MFSYFLHWLSFLVCGGPEGGKELPLVGGAGLAQARQRHHLLRHHPPLGTGLVAGRPETNTTLRYSFTLREQLAFPRSVFAMGPKLCFG